MIAISKISLLLLLNLFYLNCYCQTIELSYDVNGNRNILKLNSIQPEKPTISASLGELISSAASGNQWFYENDSIPGATSQKYKPTQSGNYKVRVRRNECVSEFSELKNFIVTALLQLPGGQYIKIGPNPVTDNLNIYFQLNNTNALLLAVFDINGKLLIGQQPITNGQSIAMNGFAHGVYIISIATKNKKIDTRAKIMKVH